MTTMPTSRLEQLRSRKAPLEMTEDEFRSLGYGLIDRIASFLASTPERPVSPGETPDEVRAALNAAKPLPEEGAQAGALLERAADLLFDHSLFNGHPRFYGYVTSSAAPVGMLAELLASALNANVGAWKLAPMATEIEAQTIRWLAQFIGYPADCGGLLLSGGNMANLTCFLAARAARTGWDARKKGVAAGPPLVVYASRETHTWIQKTADITGLGTDAIRWIDVNSRLFDLAAGHPDLEAITHNLSITTLRYVPRELRASAGTVETETYLNRLNQRLLEKIESSGQAFCSNAVIDGRYALRFCIVNFRTSTEDIEAIPELVVELGAQAHAELWNP